MVQSSTLRRRIRLQAAVALRHVGVRILGDRASSPDADRRPCREDRKNAAHYLAQAFLAVPLRQGQERCPRQAEDPQLSAILK